MNLFLFFCIVIALDPAPLNLKKSSPKHVRSGDAKYVQLVFTSILHTTGLQVGDSNIVVDHQKQHHCKHSLNPLCNHDAALELHELTVRKQWKFVASKSNGTEPNPMEQCRSPGSFQWNAEIKKNECVLGFPNVDRHKGTFHLSLLDNILPIRSESRKGLTQFLKQSRKTSHASK